MVRYDHRQPMVRILDESLVSKMATLEKCAGCLDFGSKSNPKEKSADNENICSERKSSKRQKSAGKTSAEEKKSALVAETLTLTGQEATRASWKKPKRNECNVCVCVCMNSKESEEGRVEIVII